MSTTKIVSSVKQINNSTDKVYGFLSDFNKIGTLIDAARNMGAAQGMDFGDKIENVETTEDTCHFTVKGFGDAGLRIVEREENKTIKLTGDGKVPFQFNMWIQLINKGPYDTRLRLTFHAELNMMMKMMLKKKLENGIEQMADGLTKIPYI